MNDENTVLVPLGAPLAETNVVSSADLWSSSTKAQIAGLSNFSAEITCTSYSKTPDIIYITRFHSMRRTT